MFGVDVGRLHYCTEVRGSVLSYQSTGYIAHVRRMFLIYRHITINCDHELVLSSGSKRTYIAHDLFMHHVRIFKYNTELRKQVGIG